VKLLQASATGLIYIVKEIETTFIYVMKVIVTNKENRRVIQRDIKIGMNEAKGNPFLVSYIEVVEKEDCFCIFMEYLEKGNLQRQIDVGHVFEEKVFFFFFFFYFF
jgi:serine/threonine protein kinase